MRTVKIFFLIFCLLITSASGFTFENKVVYGSERGFDKENISGEYTPTTIATFNGHTYALYLGMSIPWEEAREYCISQGGHLATVTSQEEHDFVSTMDDGMVHEVWIGGYRDSSFVWYWVTDEEWDYTNWQDGEPNNSSNVVGNEYCVALWPDQWNDLNSENIYEQYGFICEWDGLLDDGQGVPDGLDKPVDEKVSPLSVITYKGHTYKLFDDKLKWTEARAYCESIGGHLATVTSQEENELLISLLDNGSREGYWLGAGAGYDGWMWITGEWFYEFTNLAPSVDESYDEVHYLQMANTSERYKKGEWFATDSTSTEDGKDVLGDVGFICEWDEFIIDSDVEIESVKVESNDNKVKIDIEYDNPAVPIFFAALYGGSCTAPNNMEDGSVEFDNIQGDKKYTVKMFFWDENLMPLSDPIETEIFVK